MKRILFLTFILSLTSCVQEEKVSKLKFNPSSGSTSSTTPKEEEFVPEAEKPVAMKTFNQYNMSLSKATDIDAATTEITTEYNTIKFSLPSEHDVSNFTPFHQITMTRLAFAYCKHFVDNNNDFKSLNYSTTTPDALTTMLMNRFIGTRSPANSESFDKYQTVVLKILQNNAGTDENGVALGKLVPNAANTATERKNLTKLACTAILSSAEFTTL